MPKIYILGAVGSGKTTLAKKLSNDLKISYYELDKIVWKYHPDGDIKRSEDEIRKIFNKIIIQDNWIIEDVGRSCFKDGLSSADTIIYIKLTKFQLYNRILIRHIKQNLGIEKASYKSNLKMLRCMFLWAKNEINHNKIEDISELSDKVVILNKNKVKSYKYY